jgi:hypothetical protein
MKQVWQKPELEVLDISLTMNGPGRANPDCFDTEDPSPAARGETHDGMSNASCRQTSALPVLDS